MILLVLMSLFAHVNRLARDPSFLSTVLASSSELFLFQQLVHLLQKGWPGYFARSWWHVHNASAAVCAWVLPTHRDAYRWDSTWTSVAMSPTVCRHDRHFLGAEMLLPMVSSSREGKMLIPWPSA